MGFPEWENLVVLPGEVACENTLAARRRRNAATPQIDGDRNVKCEGCTTPALAHWYWRDWGRGGHVRRWAGGGRGACYLCAVAGLLVALRCVARRRRAHTTRTHTVRTVSAREP